MNPPTPELVTRALEQILASPLFARAGRQSRFLRHIVERKLAEDDAALREMVIGIEVYERPASYDPKEDPIVRVEASRLRGRLREFYETVEDSQPVIIRLPKGSYVPVFDWRIVRAQPELSIAEPPIAAEPLPRSIPPAPTIRQPVGIRGVALGVAWGVALLCVLTALGIFWYLRQQSRPFDSIAVMPFTDLSEKHDLSHLASGLTEQIEEELGTIRDLRVVGDTTVKQEAGNPDLRTAAHRMGASALLEGSIREDDRKVRVTVRLYDGETGTAIWSSSFDGDRGSLFDFEEKIAVALTEKLNLHLAARREGIDARRDPRRAKAYEYLVEARTMVQRESAGSLDVPYSLLQQAVATDPNYGAAHAALASLMIQSRGALSGAEGGVGANAMALGEVRRALALDPASPAAHSAEIVYYRDLGTDWKKARELCAAGVTRYPNSAQILDACATIEGDYLSFAKSVELTRRAMLIDPLSSRPHSALMLALYRAGQFEEALQEAATAQRLAPANYFVRRHHALILAARGQFAEGLKVIDDARTELGGEPENWMTVRGYILGRMGSRAEARRLLHDYEAKGTTALNEAVIHLGMDERARTLDLLERTFEADPSMLAHAIAEYYCRSLDGEPRFESLKRRLGILTD